MSDKKPTFEQICDPQWRRAELLKEKSGAVWTAFLELDGLLNLTKLARQYFRKSQSWFSQKLHGVNVCNKKQAFNPEEYHQLAEAFRDIARRLQQHADEIDAAKLE
ncbi:MAG: DUF5053 domain-containing protein [Muribaculaceae bacterium]|nr:DUF5053 domain-containing protein [Muribaculaceae bacterium]